MNIRPIAEDDIPAVINLFRLNYGDDYAIPEFYDPQWVKRGVYSDHIIWLVIEDLGRIVAAGACILNFGDYNDQIGEIGRLVVDPTVQARGLGRAMLSALVDASDERVEFAFAEARTVHPKTQRIDDRIGLVPLGFLPMYYMMSWRESLVVSGQLFGNGRGLRRAGEADIIPEVLPLAERSLKNLELDEKITVRHNVRPYPVDQPFNIQPLTGASLVRVLQIEQGRLTEPEVFGSMHVDQGLSQIQLKKAQYLVAHDSAGSERAVGAVGCMYDERNRSVRINELIGQDDAVKGSLLRLAVETADTLGAEVVKIDVSAYSPRLQQTMLNLGFLPAGYIPGMIFHHTNRWDVVKMMKLNVPWDLGTIELTEPSQVYYDLVVPAFQQAADERARKRPAAQAKVLAGLTPLEVEFFHRVCTEAQHPAGAVLAQDSLHIVLEGSLASNGTTLDVGESVGAGVLLGVPSAEATANEGACVLSLNADGLSKLAEQYPRLAVKLYQNLAAQR
jgi:RimJ/RimL family protein N-acetyltransferase